MNQNPQIMTGYNYHQPPHGYVQENIHPNTTNNILFVADLSDDITEEDLSLFFKDYQFKVAKVYNNLRGSHAFVSFHTAEFAEKARNELNGVKIRPKYSKSPILKPVRLCKYETRSAQDNHRNDNEIRNLLVKNISKSVPPHQFFKILRAFGDIRSCKLNIDSQGQSKGYGYVNFYSSESAARAKRELNDKELEGKKLIVTELIPGRPVEKKRNNIYVKHIPTENFTDDDLKNLFQQFGEILNAAILKDNEGKSKGFGFVCFKDPKCAEIAYQNLQGKRIWEEIKNPLYVNFAMKKQERVEILKKERAEIYKNYQKLTVYVKIKDESKIVDENSFTSEINNCLTRVFGETYKPLNLKVRYESKNAFITAHSKEEAENFVGRYKEISIKEDICLYFNLFRSKQDRAQSMALLKRKYNNFDEMPGQNQRRGPMGGKIYNNFDSPMIQQQQMNPNMPRTGYRNYNDFGPGQMNPNMPSQPMPTNQGLPPNFQQQHQMRGQFQNYNNFDNQGPNQAPNQQQLRIQEEQFRQMQLRNQQIQQQYQLQQQQIQQQNIPLQSTTSTPLTEDEKEDFGSEIYEIVSEKYSDEAPKITGMLLDHDRETLTDYLKNKNKLRQRIEEAYKLLKSHEN